MNVLFLFSSPRPCAPHSAKEVAKHLARVVASAKLLQKALPKRAAGRTSGGGGGGLAAVLKAFMRGLKTIAVVGEPGSSLLVASVRGACLEFGSEISCDVVKRAASFLLQSLESLGGGPEVREDGESGNTGGAGVERSVLVCSESRLPSFRVRRVFLCVWKLINWHGAARFASVSGCGERQGQRG